MPQHWQSWTFEFSYLLDQESVCFFCEVPDSEYFQLCRLYGLCYNSSTLPLLLWCYISHRFKWVDMTVFQVINFIYKNRQWLDLVRRLEFAYRCSKQSGLLFCFFPPQCFQVTDCVSQSRFWHLIKKLVLFAVVVWVFFHVEF